MRRVYVCLLRWLLLADFGRRKVAVTHPCTFDSCCRSFTSTLHWSQPLPSQTASGMRLDLSTQLVASMSWERVRFVPFNASFGTVISQCRNSIIYSKIDDHGVRRGDTGWILAGWRRPVAHKVALNMLHQAMCLATHRRILMTINMAHNGGTFVHHHCLFRLTYRSEIT